MYVVRGEWCGIPYVGSSNSHDGKNITNWRIWLFDQDVDQELSFCSTPGESATIEHYISNKDFRVLKSGASEEQVTDIIRRAIGLAILKIRPDQ